MAKTHKMHVIFRKRATSYRVLLQKMTYEDKPCVLCAGAYRVAKTHRMPYKLQVNLRKSATNYRALFQKMTYEDTASYGSSLLYDTPRVACLQRPYTL